MSPQTLDSRIEKLEERVTVLEQLPARVDALTLQIVQLREEMHAGFSATQNEIHAGDEETCRSLREEIRAGDEETRRSLREEIRAGDEETRRQMHELHAVTVKSIGELHAHMLMLHEDVVSRIALTHGGRSRRGKRR